MATSDGKTVDAIDREGWRSMPDGHVVLGEAEVRLVRAMLARDRSTGKVDTVRALGLKSADALDSVTVGGAPSDRVERARKSLAAWGATMAREEKKT